MSLQYFSQNINTESEMLAFGAHIAASLPPSVIIFLHGELGAGKTTLTRGLLSGLGYDGKVKSPTYTLVEPYQLAERTLFHFDLYRLTDPSELQQIGVQDYFNNDAICIVEWPDKGDPVLPQADLNCYLDFTPGGRCVRIASGTQLGETLLKRISSSEAQ